jgi:hypothetical protein
MPAAYLYYLEMSLPIAAALLGLIAVAKFFKRL